MEAVVAEPDQAAVLADVDISGAAVNELAQFRDQWKEELSKPSAALSKPTVGAATSLTSRPLATSSAATSSKHAGVTISSSSAIKRDVKPDPKLHFKLQPEVKDAAPPPPSSSSSLFSQSSSVSTPAAVVSKKDQAIEAYKRASRFEREGNLNEAVRHYRFASKLHPEVDQLARDLLRLSPHALEIHHPHGADDDRHGPDDFATFYSFHLPTDDDAAAHPVPGSEGLLALVASGHDAPFNPRDASKPCPLARLPQGVISAIVRWAVVLDGENLVRVSLVCKQVYLCSRSRTIWREMCARNHAALAPHRALTEECRVEHGGDWLAMWLRRPRVRSDGIFISRVNYVKQGYAESYSNPILMVTYFRRKRHMLEDCGGAPCSREGASRYGFAPEAFEGVIDGCVSAERV
ncbi:F-box only protein 9 [Irineochytrium annulatum]|nr:F-box only protein 9 [Irineochytrium annulatum]